MTNRDKMSVCLLAGSNLAGMLILALSDDVIARSIAAIWIAGWLTLGALVPAGAIFGEKS